jgi:hypothetical protein
MSACSIPASSSSSSSSSRGPRSGLVQSAHLMGMRTGSSAHVLPVLSISPTCGPQSAPQADPEEFLSYRLLVTQIMSVTETTPRMQWKQGPG